MKMQVKHRVSGRFLNRPVGETVIINVFLLVLGLFMVLPMIYAVCSSLKPLDELWMFPPRFFVRHPSLRNFEDLFSLMSDSWVPFSRYLFNTILVAVAGTCGNVVLSSACAYALAKHYFRGRKVIFNIIVLSLMFNTTVTAVPNFLILSSLKMINTYAALIIPAFASPLGLYLMKQFMEQMVPNALLEAARIDGAGEWRIFWTIVMPIVKPAWMTLVIFSFQGLWNIGTTSLIQSESLKTLNYALSQIVAGGIARTGATAASTVIMMLVPIAVFLISQSNVVQTMATSGMKE